MAKKNIFNNEDEELSEYDMMDDNIVDEVEESEDDSLDEILNEYEDEPAKPVKKAVLKKPIQKQASYSLNDKEANIMNSAMVQLEQAKLYDMFLKHNLFEGVKANPVALKRVEAELKGFILDRMQILLGMKEEKKIQQVQQLKVELPFNEVEVDFLKALAFKGTRGESAKSNLKSLEAKTISSIKQVEEAPKLKGLSKIQQEEEYEEEPEEEVEEIEEEEEELPPPPKKVIKKPIQKQSPVKKSVQSKPSTIEEIAREDIKKMSKRKSAFEMTPEELMEANKRIQNNKSGKPANAIPMPTEDAMVTHYMTQQMKKSMNPSANNTLMTMLSNKLGFSTNTVQQIGDDYED